MTQEELQEIIHNGMENLKPQFQAMADIPAKCYMQGFSDCWKALTGKDLEG